MPDWILWALLGWLLFRVAGRRRMGPARCGHGGHAWRMEREGQRQASLGRPQAPVSPTPPSPLQMEARLRSRYVSGELSVEQYEAELDKLYERPTSSGRSSAEL